MAFSKLMLLGVFGERRCQCYALHLGEPPSYRRDDEKKWGRWFGRGRVAGSATTRISPVAPIARVNYAEIAFPHSEVAPGFTMLLCSKEEIKTRRGAARRPSRVDAAHRG